MVTQQPVRIENSQLQRLEKSFAEIALELNALNQGLALLMETLLMISTKTKEAIDGST